jgi:hypothetical protein
MTIKVSELGDIASAMAEVIAPFVAVSAGLGIASWVVKTYVLMTAPPIVDMPIDEGLAAPRTEFHYWTDDDDAPAPDAEPTQCAWCHAYISAEMLLCPHCGVEAVE